MTALSVQRNEWLPDGSYQREPEEDEGLTTDPEGAQQRVPNAQELANLNAPNTGKSIWSWIKKKFSGIDDEQAYANWLTSQNRAYEEAMKRAAWEREDALRREAYYREDTAIQRRVNDIKAAGLNPWLALQGGFSGTTGYNQPSTNTSAYKGSSAKMNDSDNGTGSGLAALLFTVAKLVAIAAA